MSEKRTRSDRGEFTLSYNYSMYSYDLSHTTHILPLVELKPVHFTIIVNVSRILVRHICSKDSSTIILSGQHRRLSMHVCSIGMPSAGGLIEVTGVGL